MVRPSLHLGVSLSGAGAHPGSTSLAPPAELASPQRLVQMARTAEHGGIDFVSLDDDFEPRPAGAPPRLDALLALAHLAPLTTNVGLVATVTTTHTEPFHVSKNLASLDLVSGGRAGWRIGLSPSAESAALFGRRSPGSVSEVVREAADVVEVAGRLWDSWEDDVVIRDRATGRYVDRDKLHYVDFEGAYFSVRGPSITPRPPQGQVPVIVDLDDHTLRLAAARADVVLVAAPDLDGVARWRMKLADAVVAAGRRPDAVIVLAVATVGEGVERAYLDRRVHNPGSGLDLVGDAGAVAEALATVGDAADGWFLQLDALPHTLDWLVADVLPLLEAAGRFRRHDERMTLREGFGLSRPSNRYAREPVG